MKRFRWWWVAAALVAIAVAGGPAGAVAAALDFVGRGKRLTDSTENASGVIVEDPEALRAEAEATLGRSLSLDTYAAARMCRSEGGSSATARERIYRCNVAVNDGRHTGFGTAGVILFHTTASRDGRFGEQTSGRFASRIDPYEADVLAAEAAQAEDLTMGARKFVDGAATLARVRDSWATEGLVPGTLPDTQAGLFFFWDGELPSIAEAA